MKLVWTLLVLTIVCAIVHGAPLDEINVTDQEWLEYKTKFEKNYPDAVEDARRRQIYLQTKKDVTEHNKKYEAGLVSFSQAINQFADLEGKEVPTGLIIPDSEKISTSV